MSFYVTNAPVHAVAPFGEYAPTSRRLTQVGPATGGFVTTDAHHRTRDERLSKVNGTRVRHGPRRGRRLVLAWVRSTRVGGLPLANLARVLVKHGLVVGPRADTWSTQSRRALDDLRRRVLREHRRPDPNRIAAIDAITGSPPVNPGVDTGPAPTCGTSR